MHYLYPKFIEFIAHWKLRQSRAANDPFSCDGEFCHCCKFCSRTHSLARFNVSDFQPYVAANIWEEDVKCATYIVLSPGSSMQWYASACTYMGSHMSVVRRHYQSVFFGSCEHKKSLFLFGICLSVCSKPYAHASMPYYYSSIVQHTFDVLHTDGSIPKFIVCELLQYKARARIQLNEKGRLHGKFVVTLQRCVHAYCCEMPETQSSLHHGAQSKLQLILLNMGFRLRISG